MTDDEDRVDLDSEGVYFLSVEDFEARAPAARSAAPQASASGSRPAAGLGLLKVVGIALTAAVALALLAVLLMRVPAVQDFAIERALPRMVTSVPVELFEDDALRVLLCGTSSPLPHPTRANPCVAVFAAGRFWVVDTGSGSWNRLGQWRIPGERIGAVLLTHFHSDHIGDLGEFDLQSWVQGRPGPLTVYGPPGVSRVTEGFEAAYAFDTDYRIAHHGSEMMSREKGAMVGVAVEVGPRGESVFYEGDGLTITAIAVDHRPIEPAYGYRFDYGGRSVVVSGDTVKHQGLAAASRGADVLIHEAQSNHLVAAIGRAAAGAGRDRIAKIMSDIPDYHTTPVEAAELANEAEVGLLVFYHLTPPPPMALVEQVFLRGVDEVRDGDWLLGDDGMLIELPVDSDVIEVGKL